MRLPDLFGRIFAFIEGILDLCCLFQINDHLLKNPYAFSIGLLKINDHFLDNTRSFIRRLLRRIWPLNGGVIYRFKYQIIQQMETFIPGVIGHNPLNLKAK